MIEATWSEPDGRGHVTATVKEPGGVLTGPRPPKREGYECYFIGRHGSYSRFAYRPKETA